MANEIFNRVSLRDSGDFASNMDECKEGISLRDMNPYFFNKKYKTPQSRKLHDANFAFVMTELSKLHQKVYEPIYNTTYAQDIPIEVGGGVVDFVDRFSVEWAGMPTETQNLTGNNVNTIPRVNAKMKHDAVNVFNFEIAYDIKFVEIDKLNRLSFQKALDAIYKDAILAGWDLFCDKLAYLGNLGNNGLFTHANVPVTIVPQGTLDASQDGMRAMTDEEIVGLINGILSTYLINTNNNIKMLPDKILLPIKDATELSSRFSTLLTDTVRGFLMKHNVGIDEAEAAGAKYSLKIAGRSRLDGLGTNGAGRLVAYKQDMDYVRIDMPYPIQVYYTGPNTDRACYTTYFLGQISEIQLPYNPDANTFGPVSYYDFTKGTV